MGNHRDLFPSGLSRRQFDRLVDCADRASRSLPADLLNAATMHVHKARAAYERNRMINVRLAEAIIVQFMTATDHLSQLPTNEQYWLAGAMLYFSTLDDSEPDFSSPIGFEDDTEVLNACLRFAGLDQLCLRPEDYDDA